MNLSSRLHHRRWNTSMDIVLKKWKMRCEIRERGHLKRENSFRYRQKRLGIVGICVGAVGSVAAMIMFEDCNEEPVQVCAEICNLNITMDKQPKCEAVSWIRLSANIVSALGSAIGAAQLFLNYQEKAEADKEASDEFGSLARTIDVILQTSPEDRGDPNLIFQKIQTTFDKISKSSPSLSSSYMEQDEEVESIAPPRPAGDLDLGEDMLENLRDHLDDLDDDSVDHIDSPKSVVSFADTSSLTPGSSGPGTPHGDRDEDGEVAISIGTGNEFTGDARNMSASSVMEFELDRLANHNDITNESSRSSRGSRRKRSARRK